MAKAPDHAIGHSIDHSSGMNSIIGSRFFSALAAALLVNLIFAFALARVHVNPQDLPSAHTWEWWRIHSYLKCSPPPQIVLLGSSLMMIPVSVLDADFLGKDLDAVHHDRSQYMQTALSQSGTAVSEKVDCFNFAVPGGMISDDYMILRALLQRPDHPRMIVIGITLRDFIESHVSCAASTTTFKYFKQFFNIDDIASLAMPEVWQKFDYWQSKFIYLVGQRLNLQVALNQEVTELTKEMLGPSLHTKAPVETKTAMNVARNLKSEAEEGDFVLHTGQIYPFEDNSNEYKKRFSHPSASLFSAQATFLDKLLALADQNSVKVLLVNMPLTQANMALMPQAYYQRYFTTASQCAQTHHCAFLDVNDPAVFSTNDFRDTAHMNASGGKKLVDLIVKQINNDKALALCLRSSTQAEKDAQKLAGRSDHRAF